ncbi:exonuclease domain-containing protein [Noviherbaspirillum galbum]|uniref:DNA-directed DNA polymerase n=1 Tax=Noviherbaspirillum galbum TaxID=2709383 RepID=A0A6B3SUE3_9BURK|nr:exonuclease domain-containing protein [Noviherbaspirillum galbum]NEX64098.1 ethanolamine utilization protein [Noviherbaspirillum galbum]
MISHAYPRLAFVDLETSGGSASQDRITEIGIVQVDLDGVREWSTLVNPGEAIPLFIQHLTGITDAMVKDAPSFADVAGEVAALLENRLFIAHNARFDFGFLEHEFRRAGHLFRPPVLCSVRLSRRLFPDAERHGLDALVARFQLTVTERHRALGDAQLIRQFWEHLHALVPAQAIESAVGSLTWRPRLPHRLAALQVESLPARPGAYVLHGEDDVPLYVGKASNLRAVVIAQAGGARMPARQARLIEQVKRVTWTETGGNVGAELHRLALHRSLLAAPREDAGKRPVAPHHAWRLASRKGSLLPMLVDSNDMFFGYDAGLFGLFDSVRQARDALRRLCDEHGLCRVRLGLEKGTAGASCLAGKSNDSGKACMACDGRETQQEHDARLRAALAPLRLREWPYPSAIAIREGERLHVISGWAFQGSAPDMDGALVLASKGREAFDADVYRFLADLLERGEADIVELDK